ncbi:outer membrane protein assembly factor BamB [Marinomonas communis]|jgi:outer membrane protein assembly factor BamB|uniref:Outer membrane protein assembly factor BamB n=1 Tax=Marinomonas communis TaxID=28254 RepID=A0A4R6WZF6_9GAMM|nr:outer membrane protein assembly factor BamB [Marinomonas communis]MCC4275005.1 outer membrane protein assembly factor BamB [Marinomonas communis]TDR06595.1 Beta-barrel assembly machine subunit BamB [Marinomonas communis]
MMWKPIIAAAVLSSVLLQGCSTRQLPPPSGVSQAVYFDANWRTKVNGDSGEQTETYNIVPQGDTLTLVTNRGAVYELLQSNGLQVKHIDTQMKPSAGVSRDGDRVFFGTYDGELVAVSLADESVLWRKTLTSEILSETGNGEGRVAALTGDGWLTVMDASTGETLWRDKEDLPALTVRGTTAPVIVDGKVIAGFASGKVKAYNLQTGDQIWEYAVGKPEGRYEIERLTDVSGRFVIANNMLYSVAYNGTVTALAMQTGRPVWQRNISSAVGVAVQGNELAVIDQDNVVYSLNARNGSTLWQNDTLQGRDLASPVFYKDYVAVLDRGGWIHLMNRETGVTEAWTLADSRRPAGSRMVSNDEQLFILTPTANVTALHYW